MEKKPADISPRFLKPYDPAATEDRIYELWEKSGFFDPDKLPERNQKGKPFSIVLPPPNVTGTLHMGHAAMLAIEDIMIRFERMKGRRTLWLPGTDHAAIATQSKVEKELEKKEGKHRRDLGREEFLKRVDAFAKASHDTIINQVRKMGASVDWSREAFTLDAKRSLAVRAAFAKMFELGLIYRGHRIVNWDPKGQTTISDDEIVYEERKAKLYTFKYSKDFPIPIATTRPETKFGDVAVAVHPKDERYKELVGKTFEISDFAGRSLSIEIVADEAVDPGFGTGAVGVTPAHSLVDAEIAVRHGLIPITVIDKHARMTEQTGIVTGMKVAEAREKVVEWLSNNGLLEKIEDTTQNVSLAERTNGLIEPLIMDQWFVSVNKEFVLERSDIPGIKSGSKTTLKEIMRKTVESKAIKIIPDRFEKIYFNWIDNLRDWCISRQIWYGHRIPAWFKGDQVHVGTEAPKGDGWKQDEDTLDTWFSSGLWTFSTLGWPEETKDLEAFHPTDVLETGYDIIFFWVARMILMTGCLLGDIPFRTVYLHGLVRDAKGRKMSKSLDNIIDPLDLIKKYGADATRLALIIGTGPGNDMKLSEDKVRGHKLFANKLWNIARFVLSSADLEAQGGLNASDKQIMGSFKALMKEITVEMDQYKYYLVGDKLYHYAWHEFADKVIEESKPIFSGADAAARASRSQLIISVFTDLLKALHPFMPFITEEIWSEMPVKDRSLLMVEGWPA